MEKLKTQSRDVVGSNVEKIRALFPHCVTERRGESGQLELAVDFEKLQLELSDGIIGEGEERYQFTWPDKRKAIREANVRTTSTLRPCRAESVDFNATENLYIEGDNLEVLKVLRETYLGKVKMIYIDPPYNTGNDFVYNDDFAQGKAEFEAQSGLFDEEGRRMADPMVQNTESNGRFHTDWLNMIYPRLKVARDLLTEDGVIFISIDDNEDTNLLKISNEIFGEVNFIGQIVWQSTQKNDPRFIAINHEYVLCYTKNIEVQNLGGKWRTKHPLVDEMMSEYQKIKQKKSTLEDIQTAWASIINKGNYSALKHYKFVDFKGPYFAADISDPQRKGPKHDFVIHPITKQVCKAPAGGYSPREEEMKRRLANDEIHFGATHEQVVCSKKYLITAEDRLNSVYYEDGRRATKLLEALVGKGIFEHPKSEIMIKRLIGFITDDNSIILDFFSGSATTAHAVMKLNAEDGGNRKFIMVQLPEKTDEKSEAYKAGYKNICEIGKERIRRAGKKVKEEAGLQGLNLDTGFRVLKLDSSNMEDVYYTPESFDASKLFVDNVKADRSSEDLLFQVMLELGVELSAKIESREVSGKEVYFVDDNYLIACFDTDVNEAAITEIANMNPVYFVMRDSSMLSDNVADNFDQIFQHYSKDTVRRIL